MSVTDSIEAGDLPGNASADTIREWAEGNREALLRAVKFYESSSYDATTTRIRKYADSVPQGSVTRELRNLTHPAEATTVLSLPPLIEVVEEGEGRLDPNTYSLTDAGERLFETGVLRDDVPSASDVVQNVERITAIADRVDVVEQEGDDREEVIDKLWQQNQILKERLESLEGRVSGECE